jgi:hypothetical protein
LRQWRFPHHEASQALRVDVKAVTRSGRARLAVKFEEFGREGCDEFS